MTTTTEPEAGLNARLLALEDIGVHPANVRRDLGDLDELRLSIREQGIIEPLIVAPNTSDDAGPAFVLIAGHRRYACAELEVLQMVPAVIRADLDTEPKQIVTMLAENGPRAALTPIEEADAYGRLLLFDYTPSRIAKDTGRSESTIRRRLHLTSLPDAARTALHAGQITLHQADAIADAVSPDDTVAVDRLVAAVGRGANEVDLELDRLRRVAEWDRRLSKLVAELEAAGHTVLRADPSGAKFADWIRQSWVNPRDVLNADQQGVTLILDVFGVNNEHWYLAAPPSPPVLDDDGEVPGQQSVEDELDAQRAAREQAARDQKQADLEAAAEIRTTWLRKLLTQRPAPVTVATMLRQLIAATGISDDDCDLLGLDGDVEWFDDDVRREQANAWSTPRLVQVLWAQMVYRPHPLSDSPYYLHESREYLGQLVELGYELTSVEAALIAPDAGGAGD